MSTTSQHLGLKIPDGSDPFLRTDFVQNYTTLDSYPGTWICTSTTRPTWGTSQTGMLILETDTRRTMLWSGTAWKEMLTSPAMWYGTLRPYASIGRGTTVTYTVGTFTTHRPGSLLVLGSVEAGMPNTSFLECNFRTMIDGVESNPDPGYGEYMGTNFPGTTNSSLWSATNATIGVRNISSGSHSIGMRVITNSTGGTFTMRVSSFRMVALFTNATDT